MLQALVTYVGDMIRHIAKLVHTHYQQRCERGHKCLSSLHFAFHTILQLISHSPAIRTQDSNSSLRFFSIKAIMHNSRAFKQGDEASSSAASIVINTTTGAASNTTSHTKSKQYGQHTTVIVGAGSIGLWTAYYVAQGQGRRERSHTIIVIETTISTFGATSGTCTRCMHYAFHDEDLIKLGKYPLTYGNVVPKTKIFMLPLSGTLEQYMSLERGITQIKSYYQAGRVKGKGGR